MLCFPESTWVKCYATVRAIPTVSYKVAHSVCRSNAGASAYKAGGRWSGLRGGRQVYVRKRKLDGVISIRALVACGCDGMGTHDCLWSRSWRR